MAEPVHAGMVRAGGGIVIGSDDTVIAVHRPRYDDWSLPKGKAIDDEPILACALREVAEETGVDAVPIAPVGVTRYRLADGRIKVVTWFLMLAPAPCQLRPDGVEVDQVTWIPLADAPELLHYGGDVELLRALRAPSPGM